MEQPEPLPQVATPAEVAVEADVIDPPAVSWWGAIPVVALVILQLLFGWPKNPGQSANASYVVGYMMGGILIPVLLAYLFGYFFYRVTRRSQVAGTVAFCAMMGLLCLGVLARGLSHLAPNRAGRTSSIPTPMDFGEFSFEVPADWAVSEVDSEENKAKIGLLDTANRKWIGLLRVDAGETVIADAALLAKDMTQPDGHLLESLVNVDGERGVRFETPSQDLSRPRHGVVLLRNGETYMIMVAADDGSDVAPAFEHVLRTWRWKGH